jgi:hypothetical protein
MTRRRRLVLATLAVAPLVLVAGPAAAGASRAAQAADGRADLAGRNGNCVSGTALGCVSLAYPLQRTPLLTSERPGSTLRPAAIFRLSPPERSGQATHEAAPARITPLAGRRAARGPPGLS